METTETAPGSLPVKEMPVATQEDAAAEPDLAGATLNPEERQRIRREAFDIVSQVWPELHARQRGTKDDEKHKQKLVTAFERHFDAMEMDYALYVLALHIQEGNLQNIWKITFPPFRVRLRRPRSPFTSWGFQGAQFLAHLDYAFWCSIEAGDAVSDRELALQLIAAAILFGGQHGWERVHGLCGSSAAGLGFGSGRLWLDVPLAGEELAESGGTSVPVWRWEPHWVPGILLCRWKARGGRPLYACLGYSKNPDRNVLWAALLDFFVRHRAPAYFMPPSLTALMEWSATRLVRDTGMGMLVGYARGQNAASSLLPGAWERFLIGSGWSLKRLEQPANRTVAAAQWVNRQAMSLTVAPHDQTCLAEISQMILRISQGKERREAFKPAIGQLRQKHAVSPASAMDALLRWCGRLIDRRIGHKGHLSAKSVYGYLNVLGKRLLRQPVSSFVSASEEELIAWYEGMLDECSTDMRRAYLSRQIADFHACLRIEFGTQDVDFSEVDGFIAKECGVDANLVTPAEYDRIFGLIEPVEAKESSRQAWVCTLALVFGFRAGLRLGEIRRLRIADIVFPGNEILYIRPNIYGNLKSACALRQIPLRVLITEKEAGYLRRWIERRKQEAGGNLDAPLHALEPYASTILPPAALTDVLHEAMRLVTGDPAIRFHMLRHSCANWLFIKLVADSVPSALDTRVGAFDHPEFSDEAVRCLRRQMMGQQAKKTIDHDSVKAALYRVSLLLGHSGTEITLRHYVHLLDFLLGCAVQSRALNLRPDHLARLLGTGKPRVYALLKRARREQRAVGEILLATAARKAKVRKIKVHNKDAPAEVRNAMIARLGHVSEHEFTDMLAVASILPALNDLESDSQARAALGELAKRHGVDVAMLRAWFDVAMDVRYRYVTGARNARHQRFPVLPHGFEERVEFVSLLVALRRGLNDPSKADHIRWGMEQFMRRAVINRRELTFEKPAEARRYIKFLACLGIERKRLLMLHLPRRGCEPGTEIQDRRWWAENLGIPEENARRRDSEANRVGCRHGAAALSVQSQGFVTQRSRRGRSEVKVVRQAAMSFGNAIQLFLIQAGYEQHMAARTKGADQG